MAKVKLQNVTTGLWYSREARAFLEPCKLLAAELDARREAEVRLLFNSAVRETEGDCRCRKCREATFEAGPAWTYTLGRLVESNEWIIRARLNGKRAPEADFYTDDRRDAEDTLAALQAREFEQRKIRAGIEPVNAALDGNGVGGAR